MKIMKKKSYVLAALMFAAAVNVNAESITDTFDANAYAWTECAFESNNGSAVIDQGVLTIKSKGENKAMGALLTAFSGVKTQVGQNTFFETHCYAPISLKKDFRISADVKIDKLASDRLVGFVFNYRDGGNFYCFSFNDEMVNFQRYENSEVVGRISQGIKWSKKNKLEQRWTLVKDGDELAFLVDDLEILRVRYMPLQYDGIGFYTFGKQTLIVNEMEYQQ